MTTHIESNASGTKLLGKHRCGRCEYASDRRGNLLRHQTICSGVGTATVAATVTASGAPEYTCPCGKIYRHRGSLYNHRINCARSSKQMILIREYVVEQCRIHVDGVGPPTTPPDGVGPPTTRATDRNCPDRKRNCGACGTADSHIVADLIMDSIDEVRRIRAAQARRYIRKRNSIKDPDIRQWLDRVQGAVLG
jgi:hypothetical protein